MDIKGCNLSLYGSTFLWLPSAYPLHRIFFLSYNERKKNWSYSLSNVFYCISWWHLHMKSKRNLCVISCFKRLWGQDGKEDGSLLHIWLSLSHDSSLLMWQEVSFSFSFGIIVYEKKTFKWQNPDSRCLAEVKGLLRLLLPPPPFTGMTEWKDACPPPAASHFLPYPLAPPSFIFVVWIIFKPFILFVPGFLRRNSTVQWANPFGVCGRQGREDSEKSPLNK